MGRDSHSDSWTEASSKVLGARHGCDTDKRGPGLRSSLLTKAYVSRAVTHHLATAKDSALHGSQVQMSAGELTPWPEFLLRLRGAREELWARAGPPLTLH